MQRKVGLVSSGHPPSQWPPALPGPIGTNQKHWQFNSLASSSTGTSALEPSEWPVFPEFLASSFIALQPLARNTLSSTHWPVVPCVQYHSSKCSTTRLKKAAVCSTNFVHQTKSYTCKCNTVAHSPVVSNIQSCNYLA